MSEHEKLQQRLIELAGREDLTEKENDGLMEVCETLAALAESQPKEPELFESVARKDLGFEAFTDACKEHLDLQHEGQNLLFPVISTNCVQKIRWLVEQGVDPAHADDNGYTPLILAALHGSPGDEVFDYLCTQDGQRDQQSSYGESAVGVSIRSGRYQRVIELIGRWGNPPAVGFSPLHLAAATGDLGTIRKLANPETLASKDRWERTPWLTALCADQVAAAECLEQLGADSKAVGHLDASAVGLVCQCNAPEALQFLLDRGGLVNTIGHFEQTPLHLAAENDAIECARILIEAGADLSALNETEARPISLAASLEMVQLLHAHGADLNFTCGAGQWPLKDFAEDGELAVVRWLLDHGADPNTTSTGETAIFGAIRFNHLAVASLLIERGANVNQQDVDGDGLFSCCDTTEAADLLLRHGADPALQNQISETAMEASYVEEEVRDFIRRKSGG